MRALPPVAPPGWWKASLRLLRDHYVRLDTCDYSVHPLAVGRRIEVAAKLDQVLVTCDGVEVARHARGWARHQTITDPDHAAAAAAPPPQGRSRHESGAGGRDGGRGAVAGHLRPDLRRHRRRAEHGRRGSVMSTKNTTRTRTSRA